VLRLALLLLVAMLVWVITHHHIIGRQPTWPLLWVCLLAVAALPAWTPPRHFFLAPLGRLAEVVVTVLGATTLADHFDGGGSALLPYLIVPAVLPALEGFLRESVRLLAVAAIGLIGIAIIDQTIYDTGYLLSVGEWLAIALLTATAGRRGRRSTAVRAGDPAADPAAYGGPAAARGDARPGRHRRASDRGDAGDRAGRPGRGPLRQRRRKAGRAGAARGR
jgi:hypothetical protein